MSIPAFIAKLEGRIASGKTKKYDHQWIGLIQDAEEKIVRMTTETNLLCTKFVNGEIELEEATESKNRLLEFGIKINSLIEMEKNELPPPEEI